MKLIIQSECPMPMISKNNSVIVSVYERQPEKRVLHLYDYCGPNGQCTKQLELPYMQFMLTTTKTAITTIKKDGQIIEKFSNDGLNGNTLKVFCTEKSIDNLDTRLHFSPFDMTFGSVCTDHIMDGHRFNSLKELVNWNINFWYTARHIIPQYAQEVPVPAHIKAQSFYKKCEKWSAWDSQKFNHPRMFWEHMEVYPNGFDFYQGPVPYKIETSQSLVQAMLNSNQFHNMVTEDRLLKNTKTFFD